VMVLVHAFSFPMWQVSVLRKVLGTLAHWATKFDDDTTWPPPSSKGVSEKRKNKQ